MRAEDDDIPGDEAFAASVVGRFGSGNRALPGEACPDANLFAAARSGRLLAEERESLEEHLRQCGRCRGILAAIARASDTEIEANSHPSHAEARPSLRPVRRHWIWATAAAALITATLALTLQRWLGRQPGADSARTEDLLLASARDLADIRPDLFADFLPFDAAELATRAPVLRAPTEPDTRGPLTLLEPAGTILDARPVFRWIPLADAAEYEIIVEGVDGQSLWRSSCGPGPFPYPMHEQSLRDGTRYRWRLSAKGPHGDLGALRAFDVATSEEAAAFAVAAGAIQATASGAVRDLLRAHYALRAGLIGEAERAARAHVAAAPDDPLGLATLAFALRLLGSPEAEAFDAGATGRDR